MAKTGLLFTLTIVCVVLVSTEDISNTTEHPEKTILKRADGFPQKEDPSFMSRLASWIFPFGGGGDSVPAEAHRSGQQYLPPGNQNFQGYDDKDCNPCDKEPWVPVATDYGKNTIIGFMHPQELQQHQGNLYHQNGGHLVPPQPSGGYGVPTQNYGPPQQSYGPPQQNYGTPQVNPPQQNYGTPQVNPPQQNYGPPQINPPQQNYGAPQQNYGPPVENHGPPQQNYGPPPENQLPPLQTYGPPLENHVPPQQNYGPPQQTTGPPHQSYGPPIQNYGPPTQNYGPPPQNMIPPAPNYGPPKQPFNPPKDHYGTPPKPFYGPPKIQNHRPRHTYGVPRQQAAPAQLTNQYRPPPPNHASLKLKPAIKYNNVPIRSLATNMVPPPLVSQNFPPSSYVPPPAGLVGANNYRPSYAPQTQQHNNYPPANQFGGNFKQTNPDYLPPRTQLPISSLHPSNLLPPIPLPNLSPLPVAPLHNPQPFLDNYSQPGSQVEIHSNGNYNGGDVQIQQSIAVADFVASIEHPINVIHSPILEVNVANTSSQADFPDEELRDLGFNFNNNGELNGNKASDFKSNFGENNFQPNTGNFVQPEPVYTNDNPKEYNNLNTDYDDSNRYNLSDNPIIVDDTHAAASNFNGTYQNENKTENVVYTNVGSSEISSDLLNQIIKGVDFKETTRHTENNPSYQFQAGGFKINSEEVNSEQTYQFTQPSIDYSNWSPKQEISTSMVPPPIGESFWLTTVGQSGAEVTTKKPKQIQIIIPYTTNTNSNNYYDKNAGRKVPENSYQNNLPLFTQPPSIESVWTDHTKNDVLYNSAESQEVTNKPTTQVINIKDLFKAQTNSDVNFKNLPFDIIRFQKNIDDWTEQEYANKMLIRLEKATSTTRLVPSKKIPDEYLTTIPYGDVEDTTGKDFYDHEPAGSSSKEYEYKDDLESNLVVTENNTDLTTHVNYKNHKSGTSVRPSWDKIQIAVSPLTKEKVYVVTPVPKLNTTTMSWKAAKEANLSTTFSISILPMKNETDLSDVRIVLSEWPHLINNLATTVKTPTSRHPLFGLMDLSSYAPPENATIQTYSGHSKVINAASAITKKKPSGLEEKKATTIKTTTLKIPT